MDFHGLDNTFQWLIFQPKLLYVCLFIKSNSLEAEILMYHHIRQYTEVIAGVIKHELIFYW